MTEIRFKLDYDDMGDFHMDIHLGEAVCDVHWDSLPPGQLTDIIGCFRRAASGMRAVVALEQESSIWYELTLDTDHTRGTTEISVSERGPIPARGEMLRAQTSTASLAISFWRACKKLRERWRSDPPKRDQVFPDTELESLEALVSEFKRGHA